MTSPFARGACPRLSEPMHTGDGLLARIATAGPIPLDDFVGFCAAAREHGNGVMEISARGSLQVRGLTAQSAPLFAARVTSLAIDFCEGVPVIASPLQGDPASLIDADAIAAELRHAIAERHLALAPKVSVIVDGGGSLHLDALSADIRLRAIRTAAGLMLHFALSGDASSATPLGLAAVDDAAQIVTALLAAIASLGPEARATDLLRAEGISGVRAALRTHIHDPTPLAARRALDPVEPHRLNDGYALGLGLAFGHAQADALAALADAAKSNGAHWVRPAPARSLLLGPLSEAKAVAVKHAVERLGFITNPRDPRRRIVACPGAPACASGLIATRAIAAELSSHLPASLPLVHVSGCVKGCAHPGPAPLTIVGTSRGCGIVRDGTARDLPQTHVAADNLAAALALLTKTLEPAHA